MREWLALFGGLVAGFFLLLSEVHAQYRAPSVQAPSAAAASVPSAAPMAPLPRTEIFRATPLPTTPQLNKPQDLPRAAVPLQVAPPPLSADHASGDCSVKELECSQSCYTSGADWSRQRSCLRNQCEIKDTNCLEKLYEEFQARRAAGESTLTFQIKSDTSYIVQVEFYSQQRRAAWPGNGRAYDIKDYNTHSYTLSCIANEKVCYGAWRLGNLSTYWGVGFNDRYTCKDCCARCNGGTVSQVLVE